MPEPAPLEITVLNALRDAIAAIKESNGFEFNVGRSNVHTRLVEVASVNTPCIAVVRRELTEFFADDGHEVPFGSIGYEGTILVGWVISYSGDVPHEKAARMVENIHRAIKEASTGGEGTLIPITATRLNGSTVTAYFEVRRKGSSTNITEPVKGRLYGQVNLLCRWESADSDDRRIP